MASRRKGGGVNKEPTDTTSLYAELAKQQNNHEHEKGIKTCNKILNVAPGDATAFHCKVICLMQLGRFETALQQIEVTENKQHVTVALPRKGRRAQSLPRGQISSEESSFRVSLPGSARTSRQARYLLFLND